MIGGKSPIGGEAKDGKEVLDEVFVKKGQHITIAIAAYNRSKDVWGDDADEFKLERWLPGGSAIKDDGSAGVGKTGMYAGLMSFLGGSRSCVGYR
jgi:cytochrome P450